MKEVFDTHDADNTGIVRVSSLGKIFRSLGFNPLESDIQRIMKQVDPDGRCCSQTTSIEATVRLQTKTN